jgi:two-component system, OmpR family, sensor histidine kinase CiaH
MFNMFHSARLKLTGFYLAILLCFTLSSTFGVRLLADREFTRENVVQRQTVGMLERHAWGVAEQFLVPEGPQNNFNTVQQNQDNLVREHLNLDLLYFNLVTLVVGGLLSYWYAGRTLKPIQAAHEAQRRFAADASHELRTPLANMQMENEVFLRQKSFTEAEARDQIASNLEEVQRLESLATNLLALTQYERARLKLTAVPIKKTLAATLAHSAKAMESKHVTVEQSVSDAKVMGHDESLEQLLIIVIDNAIKYGPEKGKIYITGKRSGGEYALSIRDEGPGIAAHDMPHIFNRLYRGDKARTTKAEGYGLGLSLAKQIAIANGATITAANAKKGGAVFTIGLELAK